MSGHDTAVDAPAGAHPTLASLPRQEQFVDLAGALGPRFCVTIDTEEAFDWNAPFTRDQHSIASVRGLAAFQHYARDAGVKPIYLVDYPIIDDERMGPLIAQWAADGEAEVGAHLHPWVNPPFVEQVNRTNSFAGNLPREVERAKLSVLTDRISAVTGKAPRMFRAGRYGAGPHTAELLAQAGYTIDSSVRSRFDYADENGPTYTNHPLKPYWVGEPGTLLELPLSTAYVGAARRLGERYGAAVNRGGRMIGLASRGKMLRRIPLTPEGVPAIAVCDAIDALLDDEVPVLNFSFHSPTCEIGNTPYVQSTADLAAFYAWWTVVINHLARRGVAPVTIDEVTMACQAGLRSANA